MKTYKLSEIKPGRRYVVETSDEPDTLRQGDKVWICGDDLCCAQAGGWLKEWKDIPATVRLATKYHHAEEDRLREESERHENILRNG